MIQRIMLAIRIIANALPIVGMIALIPFIENDYVLALLYLTIIAIALFIHRDRKDVIATAFGFVVLFLSELLFISTGVETFTRNSFFGLMPVWLPLLWAYAFFAIRRMLMALDRYFETT